MSNWPQYVYLALSGISLLTCTAKDGQPREPYNAGYAIGAFILANFLLWRGGFFTPMGWAP